MHLPNNTFTCWIQTTHLPVEYKQCICQTVHLPVEYKQCICQTVHLPVEYKQCICQTMCLSVEYKQCHLLRTVGWSTEPTTLQSKGDTYKGYLQSITMINWGMGGLHQATNMRHLWHGHPWSLTSVASSINKNNSNATLCSKYLVFLKPFSMYRD